MRRGNEPEGKAKEKPGKNKGEREDDQQPAPAYVHTGGKKVSEVSLAPLAYVDEGDVTASVLAHKALSGPAVCAPAASPAGSGGGREGILV